MKKILNPEFAVDVIEGLSAERKHLPSKYFYDEEGSRLFSRICELDEYYITRTEIALLDRVHADLLALIPPRTVVIEPGAGDGIKVELLLQSMPPPAGYLPFDISDTALEGAQRRMREALPDVKTEALHAQFGEISRIRSHLDSHFSHWQRLLFFPGSTIGNFVPDEAIGLLRSFADLLTAGGLLFIGVDLIKPLPVLEAAYDDAEGVTAAFNLNLLKRINRELAGDFDLNQFDHLALFNTNESRIEMHLVSRCDQTVEVGEQAFRFGEGERIHTENSYKYDLCAFVAMAAEAGFQCRRTWTDEREWFALVLLEKTG